MRSDDRWDELDVAGAMWGVFATESYSADPVAMFRNEDDAAGWLAWQEALDGEDPARVIGGCDYTICSVARVAGIVWNSHDPLPPPEMWPEASP